MGAVIPLITGALFACSIYCLLQGHFIRIVAGIVLLSNAVNLLIFSISRMEKDLPPLLTLNTPLQWSTTNPLAGAMILTSIVISFGMTAFIIALVAKYFAQTKSITSTQASHPEEMP